MFSKPSSAGAKLRAHTGWLTRIKGKQATRWTTVMALFVVVYYVPDLSSPVTVVTSVIVGQRTR
ncbi:hypothetical protein [Streptomyces sp. NPDC002521]